MPSGNYQLHSIVPSVENFYWILYENLLKPSGLDCWYFYPFGTTTQLSQYEFQAPRTKLTHHVLFHFDQEPLWSETLLEIQSYNLVHVAWSDKICRILANSEKSEIKKKIVNDRGFMDWYFFFHGFAALDWFRDSRLIKETQPFRRVFSSLNHLTADKRSYRMALTARLLELHLEAFGHISFHADKSLCLHEISKPDSNLTDRDKLLIQNHILTKSLPMICDSVQVNGSFSANLGHHEYRFWQDSFIHIVNETVFYDPKLHLTEKIFKPIVALRPFLLAGAPGNLEYLRSYGFQTFSPWIDESYDTEIDPSRRLDMIVTEVKKLCDRSLPDLRKMYHDMLPVLQHNKNHFFGNFRRVIVDELVDNFEICLRLWNNGRIDGRERPMICNFDLVKNLLLSQSYS